MYDVFVSIPLKYINTLSILLAISNCSILIAFICPAIMPAVSSVTVLMLPDRLLKSAEPKLADEKYTPELLENGDSCKQLLARSRYLLFKSPDKWTEKQKQRAKLLFERYPDIKKAYSLTHSLRMIFSKNTVKDAARLSLCQMVQSGG